MSQKSKSFELASIRPLSEFLLDASKYISPPWSDLKGFNNRVCSNLLYFQTNYLAAILVNVILFLLFGFNKMLTGLIGIASSTLVALFALDKIPQASSVRAQYPVAVIGLAFFNTIICYMSLNAILYFLLSIVLPVFLSIVHASVRSRGVANKLKNKMEQVGVTVYSNTPLGILFNFLGIDPKDNLA